MSGENALQEKQVEGINDLIDGMIPAATTAAAPEIPIGEGTTDGGEKVQEGQERIEEKAGGQEPTGEPAGEKKEEVTPPPDGTIPPIPPVETEVKPPDSATAPVETKPPEETELERLKRENAELMAHLSDIAGKTMGPRPDAPKTPEEVEAEKQRQAQAARQVLKFLPSEEVFDNVLKDANSFNALLTTVVNVAVERSLRMVPQVANQLVDQQFVLRASVQSFYDENKDLLPHKKYVGFVSNEIASQHADWDLPKILEETEKEVRARLKLAKVPQHIVGPSGGQNGGAGPTRTVVDNPGFVPSGGGGRRGPATPNGNLSAQEKDIMSLIS